MFNESAISTLDAINKTVIKIIFWLFVLFGIPGVIFWAVFYSDYFANLTFIIPARNWYQKTYWQIESLYVTKNNLPTPPFKPLYTFQAETDAGLNNYIFRGTYYGIDTQKGLIYLSGYNDKIYAFSYGDGYDSMNNGYLAQAQNTNPNSPTIKLSPNIQYTIGIDKNPYSPKSSFYVQWDDKRTMTQLLKDYANDPSFPLDANSTQQLILIKYN